MIHRRQRSEEDEEDIAASIETLKKELQQSADTIIKRLGSHVTKLEGLLREADDRRVRLETRVADAQRLEWALRQRIEELERRLRDLGQTPPMQAASVSAQAPVRRPVSPAARGGQLPQQEPEVRRVDGDDFASVLHQSILREQARDPAEQAHMPGPLPTGAAPQTVPPPMQPIPLSPQRQAQAYRQQMPQAYAQRQDAPPPTARVQTPQQPADAPPPAPEETAVREDEAIIKARALLRAGRTVEQVARETGVEIGALRLMQQMTQRD